jgi:hypothetical protein
MGKTTKKKTGKPASEIKKMHLEPLKYETVVVMPNCVVCDLSLLSNHLLKFTTIYTNKELSC